MKRIFYLVTTMIMVLGLAYLCEMESKAYFERGTVSVSLGQGSLTLEQGQSGTVSISFSPSTSSQLPGCGMAECPQSCGEKNCLDENGECKCGGLSYQTYYAYANVTSSNASIASATYQNGSLNIQANQVGTATITVTSYLRQFTSMTTTMTVTVKEKTVVQTPSNNGSTGSGSSGSGSTGSGSSGSGSSGSGTSGTGSTGSGTTSNGSAGNKTQSVSSNNSTQATTSESSSETVATHENDSSETIETDEAQGEDVVTSETAETEKKESSKKKTEEKKTEDESKETSAALENTSSGVGMIVGVILILGIAAGGSYVLWKRKKDNP
jgi:hypothetical protein